MENMTQTKKTGEMPHHFNITPPSSKTRLSLKFNKIALYNFRCHKNSAPFLYIAILFPMVNTVT